MSITLRKSADRGASSLGWLTSRFTFSFAGYFDPSFQSYGALRVINEDRVEGGEGFGRHGHANFEIFSYILEGRLRHEDSMGNVEIIGRDELQFTSAGSGIHHSEFNADAAKPVRFLQMWVKPAEKDTKPRYATQGFTKDMKHNKLCLMLSPDAADDSIKIGEDLRVYSSMLDEGNEVTHALAAGRRAYIHVPVQPGSLGVTLNNDVELGPGDGAFIEDLGDEPLQIKGKAEADAVSEFILFDLA